MSNLSCRRTRTAVWNRDKKQRWPFTASIFEPRSVIDALAEIAQGNSVINFHVVRAQAGTTVQELTKLLTLTLICHFEFGCRRVGARSVTVKRRITLPNLIPGSGAPARER